MQVTDEDIENLRRISEQIFDDREYVELTEVKDTSGDVMVEVEGVGDAEYATRNAFAGGNLRKYHENGYVAVAVGGGDQRHSAWFERADAVEFGEPGPRGNFDLVDYWQAGVGSSKLVLHHDGHVVAHVERDGWTLDEHTVETVLPSYVADSLREAGFDTDVIDVDQ